MKVIFYPVKTTDAKLTKIVEVATIHFTKGEPILFFVPDEAAWEFLDKLFWSTPADSFLPHPSKFIQIRHTFNPAYTTVFNLSPTSLLQPTIKTLYELEDHTSAEKLKASQDRYHTYRTHALQIIVEA
ncbi:MAG: DNA polymerase III subunit chi [Rhabdochlamydiaceae bacterium]